MQEEADRICDRIMVMVDGRIKAIGVSADLKKRFGDGFKLALQLKKGADSTPAHQFVKKLFPGILHLDL